MEGQRGKKGENLGTNMVKRGAVGSQLKSGGKKTEENNRLKVNGRVTEVEYEMMLKTSTGNSE